MIFRFCIEVIADALAQFFIQLRGGDDTSVVRLSCHECAVTPSSGRQRDRACHPALGDLIAPYCWPARGAG